jgi:hypothetical protein
MPTQHPINFEEKVRLPRGSTGSDYPYSIKAQDLMKNFVYAALDVDESLIEKLSGEGGYQQRKLKIDPGTEANQIYIWDGSKITVIATPTEGSVLAFTGGAFSYVTAPSSGTHVLGCVDGTIQWIATEECA